MPDMNENAEIQQEYFGKAKEGKVVEHFEAYGQCRDSRKIAELEAENEQICHILGEHKMMITELKDQNIKDCENFNKTMKEIKEQWNKEHYQLTKAKELLLELYDCIPSSMADSCKETLQKVALFFKDSEVEK